MRRQTTENFTTLNHRIFTTRSRFHSARCCSGHGSARKLDPDLFVAGFAPSHYVLLNKFHLLAGHVLLVTQRFERQERLTIEDSAALIACLSEVDALGFYK